MNKQRRKPCGTQSAYPKNLQDSVHQGIIKKICAVGMVGIFVGNVSVPAINYSEKIEAEKYHTQVCSTDENGIKKVVIPVSSFTSDPKLPVKNIKEETLSSKLGTTAILKESENLGESNVTGKPDENGISDSDKTNSIIQPDKGVLADNSDNLVNSDYPNGEGVSDNLISPDNPEQQDSSEAPDNSDSPDNPEQPSGGGIPDNSNSTDNPEQPNGDGIPDNSNGTDNPEQSANPDSTINPDQSEQPDSSTNSDNLEQPGQSEDSENKGDQSNPDNSEDSLISGKPGKPDVSVDSEDNSNSAKPSGSMELKPGLDINFNNENIDANKLKPEKISSEKIKNASLVLKQKLVKLPEVVEDYRFWTVARKYAFAKNDIIIRESIVSEEDKEDEVRVIGKLRKNGLLYILKEEDEWLYVESGRVRGFVRSEEVITGEEAGQQLEIYQKKAKDRAEKLKQEYTGIEDTAPMAQEWVPWQENNAYTYLRATVNQTVVEKKYGFAGDGAVEVMEDKDEGSRIIGVIPKGGLCFILEDKGEEWIYVESGDVRGFVKRKTIQHNEEITKLVEEKKEDIFPLAEEKIKPEENRACYYTLTSTKSGIPSGEIRSSIVEFAGQFVGNPYVWGGTSLTEGADCSGFVQSIYKQFGYELPRVSRDQAQYGTKIPVEDALPGDLIFYANSGNIYHVVMYAGDGKTIEAMSTDMGIVQSDVNKENAVWATRVLKDNGYEYAGGSINDVNATQDMYGKNLGTFKLTYYCACELCCNVETGITATGAPVVEGRTIAVDPKVIPYGTQVIIGGHVFTAEDCGGAIKEKHIDIYVNDHASALELGVSYADVYLKK